MHAYVRVQGVRASMCMQRQHGNCPVLKYFLSWMHTTLLRTRIQTSIADPKVSRFICFPTAFVTAVSESAGAKAVAEMRGADEEKPRLTDRSNRGSVPPSFVFVSAAGRSERFNLST